MFLTTDIGVRMGGGGLCAEPTRPQPDVPHQHGDGDHWVIVRIPVEDCEVAVSAQDRVGRTISRHGSWVGWAHSDDNLCRRSVHRRADVSEPVHRLQAGFVPGILDAIGAPLGVASAEIELRYHGRIITDSPSSLTSAECPLGAL